MCDYSHRPDAPAIVAHSSEAPQRRRAHGRLGLSLQLLRIRRRRRARVAAAVAVGTAARAGGEETAHEARDEVHRRRLENPRRLC